MRDRLLKIKTTLVFFITTMLFIYLMHIVALAATVGSIAGAWNGRNTEMPLDLVD